MGCCLSSQGPASVHFVTFCDNLPSMDGLVVAITGSTSGTGLVAAKTVAQKGAQVLMLNRPSDRAQQALKDVQACALKFETVQHIDCDLQSFESVRRAAKQVLAATGSTGLDVLVNNAGMTTPAAQLTRDGYEVHMQVNHLAHFLLSLSVLPALEQAARLRGSARIVNHSSASRKNPRPTPLQVASFAHEPKLTKSGLMVALNRYQQSKLANMLFTAALQDKLRERQSGVSAAVAVPGLAMTNFANGMKSSSRIRQCIISLYFRVAGAQSAEDGTMPLLECMCRPHLPHPGFYGPVHRGWLGCLLHDGMFGPPVLKGFEPLCKSEEGKQLLWRLSEQATGCAMPAKPESLASGK